eukprot:501940_1
MSTSSSRNKRKSTDDSDCEINDGDSDYESMSILKTKKPKLSGQSDHSESDMDIIPAGSPTALNSNEMFESGQVMDPSTVIDSGSSQNVNVFSTVANWIPGPIRRLFTHRQFRLVTAAQTR